MSSANWNTGWNGRGGRRRLVTRAGAAAATFFSLIGVGIWALLPLYIDLLPSWLDPRWWLSLWGFTLSVKWQLIFWTLLLAQAIAQALVHVAQFANPADRRLHAVPEVVANALTATVAVLALKVTGLLYVPLPTGDELHGLRGLDLVERCVQFGLIMIAIGSTIYALVSIWRVIVPGWGRAAN
jgi:hypothetical protein